MLTPRVTVPVWTEMVRPSPSSNMVRGSTPAPLNSSSWMPSPQTKVPKTTIRAWKSCLPMVFFKYVTSLQGRFFV